MLRGIDIRGTDADYEPNIVKVADCATIEGSVTIYVDEALSPSTRRRLRYVDERLAFFAEAGIVPDPAVVRWATEVASPSTKPGMKTVARYEEFREAVDRNGLGPFFDRTEDGAVSVPDVCVAFRRDGRLAGLYPRVTDGHVQTVEECLTALAAGNGVENVSD